MPRTVTVSFADGTQHVYQGVPDNATPDAVQARVRSEFPNKQISGLDGGNKTAANPAATAREQDIQARMRSQALASKASPSAFGIGLSSAFGRSAAHSATAGLVNPIQSGISAAIAALHGKNFKDEYSRNQEAAHRLDTQNESDSPGQALAGNIGGALLMPVGGPELGVGKVLTRASPKLAAIAAKVADTAVGTGVRMGAKAGALSAAGNTLDQGEPEHLIGNTLHGAMSGGSAGGVLGAGAYGVGKVVSAVSNRSAKNAENVAYNKIADLLSRSHSEDAAGLDRGPVYTPHSAQAEMAAAEAGGGSPMLMDLSPEMQKAGGFLARKPGLPGANELVSAGTDRSMNLIDRFNAKVRSLLPSAAGDDARAATAANTTARKADATAFHADGGSMDNEIKGSPELTKFLVDSPDVARLMPRAITNARRFGDDISTFSEHTPGAISGPETGPFRPLPNGAQTAPGDKAGNAVVTHIPTLKVFDYLKREFDGEIGRAMTKGDMTEVAGLSNHLKDLKRIIADANPEYEGYLAKQRDAFEKNTSLENGQAFIKQMRSPQGPRELHDLLSNPDTKLDEVKTGIVDALTHQNTPNPVALWRSMTQRPDQKAVMELLFGGRPNLNVFDKYIRRELRSNGSDKWLRQGQQSGTADLLAMGSDLDSGHAAAQLASAAGRGGAFGGVVGMASNSWAKLDQLQRGMGPEAQDALAKALMGKGENLPEKVAAAKAFLLKRQLRTRKAAQYAAKAAGAIVGSKAQE